MICNYDHGDKVWIAAGRGPMRPIVVEGNSYGEAHVGFAEEHAKQVKEEERFAREYEEGEIATHFSEAAFNDIFGQPEDLG